MPVASALAQQAYPTNSIRLVVGFAPGGATDTVARVVGLAVSQRLGQPVVVDNRAGAGGVIGTEIVARSAPDGYTLTMGTTTTHAIAPATYSKLPYDPIKDFAPIALVGVSYYLLVVHPTVKAQTLQEFVSLVKSQPGKLNYASAGHATTTHLAMATLVTRAGLDMVHVPYKGGGPSTTAVLAGDVQALFGAVPAVLTQAKAGRVRALAISSAKRSPSLPDVPTVAESGYPGFDVSLWLGFFAPRGTPAAIVKRLESELNSVVQSPEVKDALARSGAEPRTSSAAELAQLVRTEIENYKQVTRAAGIKAE
jgi:tripartite-type tricarboxylate transporter receptor subunit TctC